MRRGKQFTYQQARRYHPLLATIAESGPSYGFHTSLRPGSRRGAHLRPA
jgi:hypothetical protein